MYSESSICLFLIGGCKKTIETPKVQACQYSGGKPSGYGWKIKKTFKTLIILGGEAKRLILKRQNNRIMNMKQSKLKVDSILEYYDNPQLLTARDCFDTLYLCLLYEDTPECKYTAIRISSKRLQDFCMGKKDLRSLFLSPEGDKEYFNVRGADNNLVLDLKINTTIPEDRLPDEGYYLETSGKESIVVNIPVKDKGLFTEIVRKFGWACM